MGLLEEKKQLKKDKSQTVDNMTPTHWDNEFIAEMNKRSKEYKSGKYPVFSWKETKAAARKSVSS